MQYVIQVYCDHVWRDEFTFNNLEEAEVEFHAACEYFYNVRLIRRSIEVLKTQINKP